jgi:5-methylcytosine-specific restriction enzyme subunit McrC
VALLSHRIASHLGYGVSEESGEAEGILIDVAELWELFVLNCARQATPLGMRIEHGTRQGRRDYLLRSPDGNRQLGRLKPDVLILEGDSIVAIIDAKYKRLIDSRDRPAGIDQSDLYQLAAYAMRFRPERVAALVYPRSQDDGGFALSTAEAFGPWRGEDRNTFLFRRLPTSPEECRTELTALLASTATQAEAAA